MLVLRQSYRRDDVDVVLVVHRVVEVSTVTAMDIAPFLLTTHSLPLHVLADEVAMVVARYASDIISPSQNDGGLEIKKMTFWKMALLKPTLFLQGNFNHFALLH